MSSRREQKEQLKQERLRREQEEQAAASRRRLIQLGAGAAGILVIAVIVVVVAVAGGGSSSSSGSGPQEGVVTTPPPWAPVYDHLADRSEAMGLPDPSDVVYHVHALLHVYVNGKPVTVPKDIGIDVSNQFLASLHTHDTSGIVHMEAVKPFPFTLGEFFNIWGVKFEDNQLGPYKPGNGNVLQTWVDGKQVSNPAEYKMKPHDVIIVGYGKPDSFPHKAAANFPPGY